MKKFNFLSLIFIIFCISFNLSSKTIFLKCDALILKIVRPIIGFNKAYIMRYEKWNKEKEFEIIDKSYIFKNIYPSQTKCKNLKCRVDITLQNITETKTYLNYQSTVSNDFCSIDGSNKCYVRKIGKSLQKGYCNNITKQQKSFENKK